MKKVVLLATSHDIQRGVRLKDEYIDKLDELKENYKIKLIAEEAKDDDTYVLTKAFCDEKTLSYINIEPNDNEEKEELGINTLNQINSYFEQKYTVEEFPGEEPLLDKWPDEPSLKNLPKDIFYEYDEMFQEACRKREREWLKRILNSDNYPSLVVFGADHEDEFSKLLEENDIEIIHQEKFGIDN